MRSIGHDARRVSGRGFEAYPKVDTYAPLPRRYARRHRCSVQRRQGGSRATRLPAFSSERGSSRPSPRLPTPEGPPQNTWKGHRPPRRTPPAPTSPKGRVFAPLVSQKSEIKQEPKKRYAPELCGMSYDHEFLLVPGVSKESKGVVWGRGTVAAGARSKEQSGERRNKDQKGRYVVAFGPTDRTVFASSLVLSLISSWSKRVLCALCSLVQCLRRMPPSDNC